MVYAVAHLLAAIDTFRGGKLDWVASGAESRSKGIPARAGWTVRVWVFVSQAATWAGIFYGLPTYGLVNYWPAIVLTIFQTIVLFPLLLPNFGIVAQPTLLPHLVRKRYRDKQWQKQNY